MSSSFSLSSSSDGPASVGIAIERIKRHTLCTQIKIGKLETLSGRPATDDRHRHARDGNHFFSPLGKALTRRRPPRLATSARRFRRRPRSDVGLSRRPGARVVDPVPTIARRSTTVGSRPPYTIAVVPRACVSLAASCARARLSLRAAPRRRHRIQRETGNEKAGKKLPQA